MIDMTAASENIGGEETLLILMNCRHERVFSFSVGHLSILLQKKGSGIMFTCEVGKYDRIDPCHDTALVRLMAQTSAD